jgi:hypothetical protein
VHINIIKNTTKSYPYFLNLRNVGFGASSIQATLTRAFYSLTGAKKKQLMEKLMSHVLAN